MAKAGYNCLLHIAGTTTAFTAEAFGGSGAGPYQITDAAKQVWDHATVPTFYDNGVAINAADILTIDYLLGKVTFTGSKTGPITADGAYFPLLQITEAKSFTISFERQQLDTNVFGLSYRRRQPNLIDATGSIELFNALTEDLDSGGGTRTIQGVFDGTTAIVLSFRVSDTAANVYRLWAYLEEVETSAGVEDLVNRMFGFVMAAQSDADGRTIHISHSDS